MYRNFNRKRGIVMGIAAALLSVSSLFPSLAVQAAGDPSGAVLQNLPRPTNTNVVAPYSAKYQSLAAQWWQWALSFPAGSVPFLTGGGWVDLSAHQAGDVTFLAGANKGPATRYGTVPARTQIFLPIANLINDYPCPPALAFEPKAGESMETFLQRTANDFMPVLTDLFAEIDGVPVQNLQSYRAMSPLFTFSADYALKSLFDPCIIGRPQAGVSVGYWLLLEPLSPGVHKVRFGSPTWQQDVTYFITVQNLHGSGH